MICVASWCTHRVLKYAYVILILIVTEIERSQVWLWKSEAGEGNTSKRDTVLQEHGRVILAMWKHVISAARYAHYHLKVFGQLQYGDH